MKNMWLVEITKLNQAATIKAIALIGFMVKIDKIRSLYISKSNIADSATNLKWEVIEKTLILVIIIPEMKNAVLRDTWYQIIDMITIDRMKMITKGEEDRVMAGKIIEWMMVNTETVINQKKINLNPTTIGSTKCMKRWTGLMNFLVKTQIMVGKENNAKAVTKVAVNNRRG